MTSIETPSHESKVLSKGLGKETPLCREYHELLIYRDKEKEMLPILGDKKFLPRSFIEAQEICARRYMDAIALVQHLENRTYS
ncbi:hypothetical protein H5410_023920 [Solanum commersonii]|uniref:Uncharacterized protein n=1 Tax=Solanum commersonii TaxID=4109 RepID=A0A9J5ZKI1_SOLCO|nr:hypothetical protein H5410_023920 [Solanum commersonii]